MGFINTYVYTMYFNHIYLSPIALSCLPPILLCYQCISRLWSEDFQILCVPSGSIQEGHRGAMEFITS
jgi:hypothetical protein